MSFASILLKSYLKKPLSCTAVIAAAGTSQRCMGEDKLFCDINGIPVIAHTLTKFQQSNHVDDIIVVSRAERLEEIALICDEYNFSKVSSVIVGGFTRMESVINGVHATGCGRKLILIHDAARPCVDQKIISDTIKAAKKHHAAAPAVKVSSTLKIIEDNKIKETISREGVYEIQTPQVFRSEIIKAALSNAFRKSIEVTDDCMAVEIIGMPVHIITGSCRNIKITEKDDLKTAELLLNSALCSEKSEI